MRETYVKPNDFTDKEWSDFLADMERIEAGLRALVCPDCGAPLSKKLDPHQNGSKGAWFNYRCTAECGFLVDQCKPN